MLHYSQLRSLVGLCSASFSRASPWTAGPCRCCRVTGGPWPAQNDAGQTAPSGCAAGAFQIVPCRLRRSRPRASTYLPPSLTRAAPCATTGAAHKPDKHDALYIIAPLLSACSDTAQSVAFESVLCYRSKAQRLKGSIRNHSRCCNSGEASKSELTVLMGAMPSEPDRLSGADPGVDPDPPSELDEGPVMSVTMTPSRFLSTDLQHHFFSFPDHPFSPWQPI